MDKSIQKTMLLAIDAKIVEAAKVMELADIEQEHEDDQDFIDSVYEERFHCGTCIVTNVMETVFPSISEYFDYLEGLIEIYETRTEEAVNLLLTSVAANTDDITKSKIIDVANTLSLKIEPPKIAHQNSNQ